MKTNDEKITIVKNSNGKSNFYNIFRNTMRIVLNSVVEKDRRVELLYN